MEGTSQARELSRGAEVAAREPNGSTERAGDPRARRVLQRGFVAVALVFGIAHVLATPPFESPDEYNHFLRACHVAEGGVLPERASFATRGEVATLVGAPLPASTIATVHLVPREPNAPPGSRSTLATVARLSEVPLRPEERAFADFRNTALYAPVSYLPQAAAMRVAASLLEPPPVVLLYAGRFANLLFFTATVALAIAVTPIHAAVLFLVAAAPMALSLAASLSADAPLNALALLYLALVFAVALGTRAAGRIEVLGLVALPVAIGLAKQGYAPLCLLSLAIPVQRLGGRRRFAAVVGAALVGTLAATAGWAVLVGDVLDPVLGEVLAYPPHREERLHRAVGDPWWLASAVVRSFLVHGPGYAEQLVGVLGWLEVRLPAALVVAYLALLAAAAIGDGARTSPAWWQRAVFGAVLVANVFAVFVAIWVVWGSPSEVVIVGAQGRYFIPLAPLALALVHLRRFRIGAAAARGCVAFAALAQIASLAAMLRRFPP